MELNRLKNACTSGRDNGEMCVFFSCSIKKERAYAFGVGGKVFHKTGANEVSRMSVCVRGCANKCVTGLDERKVQVIYAHQVEA